ncbi:DHH family phosphoesterase [Colwellia sp. MEBiC06753]
MHYDVFNGDADGILALVQLRLAEPKESQLVTGVKRDIALVQQVPSDKASSVTVLDVSMEKNMDAVKQLVNAKVPVFYADHHRSGDIPASEQLTALIDLDANTCTSLIINNYLGERYYLWAIAAAFGDNMTASAQALAKQHQLTDVDTAFLKNLGIYINYNGYGRTESDLHFHPADLFKRLLAHENPLSLKDDANSVFYHLERAYNEDIAQANNAIIHFENSQVKVLELPDEAWSRRVSGVYGNELANQSPDKAHAVLTKNQDDSFTVSVRAPLNNKQGADVVCSSFATGGGRAAAAGINQLPVTELDNFISALSAFYN